MVRQKTKQITDAKKNEIKTEFVENLEELFNELESEINRINNERIEGYTYMVKIYEDCTPRVMMKINTYIKSSREVLNEFVKNLEEHTENVEIYHEVGKPFNPYHIDIKTKNIGEIESMHVIQPTE